MKGQFDELYATVKGHLQSANHLRVTMNVWSNRQMKSYTGMTAHYSLEIDVVANNNYEDT